MKTITHRLRLASFAASLFVLSSCGGGGGGGAGGSVSTPSNQNLSFSGIVAMGAAVPNATLQVSCKGGTVSAITRSDGTYSTSLVGGLPCYFQTHDPVSGMLLRSVGNSTGNVNLTPFTEAITQLQKENGISLEEAQAKFVAALSGLNITLPSDPITTQFTANKTGMDYALEQYSQQAEKTFVPSADSKIEKLTSAIAAGCGTTDCSTPQTAVLGALLGQIEDPNLRSFCSSLFIQIDSSIYSTPEKTAIKYFVGKALVAVSKNARLGVIKAAVGNPTGLQKMVASVGMNDLSINIAKNLKSITATPLEWLINQSLDLLFSALREQATEVSEMLVLSSIQVGLEAVVGATAGGKDPRVALIVAGVNADIDIVISDITGVIDLHKELSQTTDTLHETAATRALWLQYTQVAGQAEAAAAAWKAAQMQGSLTSQIQDIVNGSIASIPSTIFASQDPSKYRAASIFNDFWGALLQDVRPLNPDYKSWLVASYTKRLNDLVAKYSVIESQCQKSGSGSCLVQQNQPAPDVNSVGPTPIIGSNLPQTLTISGSHFADGSSIELTDLTFGGTFKKPGLFVNANKLTVSANFTSNAATWQVKVTNPDGNPSNFTKFSVDSPTATSPTQSIAPFSFANWPSTPITATTVGYQPALIVSGNVTKVVFNWSGSTSGGATWTKNDANWNNKVTANSDGSMTLRPTVTTSNDPAGTTNWTVTLLEGSGTSVTKNFIVVYKPSVDPLAAAPTISSVSPNPVTGSASAQTVTINGTGFVNKPTLTLTWTGQSGYTVPTAQVTYVSNTQVQMLITTTTTADNWSVKATNPDGKVSNVVGFTVK